MINANMAKDLSLQMYATGGIRGKIYRAIMYAISTGDNFISFEDDDRETVQWVLEDLVDIGYKVSRTPRHFRYRDVNEIKDYVYTIEW